MKNKTKRMDTEERKKQILKIAADIFYRDGYEKATLQEVAEKAKITKAAIYYHFKNKEQILFDLLKTKTDQLIFNLSNVNREENDPVEKLKKMMITHMSYMELDKSIVKIMMEDTSSLGKKNLTIIMGKEKELFELYRNTLKEIAAIRRLKDIRIITANFSIFAVILWFYKWYNPNGGLSIRQISEDVVKIIFYGLIID